MRLRFNDNTRDAILFFAGLTGTVYMTLIQKDQPDLLVMFAGMMGLPAFLRGDEFRRRRYDEEERERGRLDDEDDYRRRSERPAKKAAPVRKAAEKRPRRPS